MDRCNDKINTKKCYIDPQQQIPVPYGSKLHIPPTSSLLVAAKQEPYKTKSLSLNKKNKKQKEKDIEKILWKKVQQSGPAGRKRKIRQK